MLCFSFRSVGERFDMSKSSLSECFFRIVKALNGIMKRFIFWPQDLERVHRKFERSAGLKNVIGAIDGTFIPMKAPNKDPEIYRTRKMYHAITLQAICDADLKFTDCFVGYPGSVSDARIFRNSGFYKNVLNDERKYFPNNDLYIIADKAYPLLRWCIPPYFNRGNLTNAQSNFNNKLTKTRQVIERAFALLFGRYRRLKYVDMNRFSFIPCTVMACCVLDNICLQDESDYLEFLMEGMPAVQGNEQEHDEIRDRPRMDDLVREGDTKRNAICANL